MAAHQAPPSLGFSRQEYWSGLPFPSPMHESEKSKSLSRVRLLATPWTAAHQAPPSMGFSRQERWSGVPLPSPVEARLRPCCLRSLPCVREKASLLRLGICAQAGGGGGQDAGAWGPQWFFPPSLASSLLSSVSSSHKASVPLTGGWSPQDLPSHQRPSNCVPCQWRPGMKGLKS